MTLLLTGLLTAVGLALTMTTMVETWLSDGARASQELTYAADAAVGRVQVELSGMADWSAALGPGIESAFSDGRSTVVLADGTAVDLGAETRALQAESDTRYGDPASNPDAPRWHLFAHAPLDDLIPGRVVGSPLYVAAWIADDAFDGDGDGAADANRRVVVRARAFGARGARRSIEAVVGRAASGATLMLSWKELR